MEKDISIPQNGSLFRALRRATLKKAEKNQSIVPPSSDFQDACASTHLVYLTTSVAGLLADRQLTGGIGRSEFDRRLPLVHMHHMDQSIWNQSFYRPLLARGLIPGESDMPRDLLDAMAVLVGRSVGAYMDPMECRGPAALVVLALRESGWVVSPPRNVLQSSPIGVDFPCKKNNLLGPEGAEHPRRAA